MPSPSARQATSRRKLAIARQLTPRMDPQGVARPSRSAADGLRSSIKARSRRTRSSTTIRILDPRRSWTSELTGERALDIGASCVSRLFHEDTDDALYSQTNVLVTPNVTNIQNVDDDPHERSRDCVSARRTSSGAGSICPPASPTRTRESRETRRFPRASASGSRACRNGARTRSRPIALGSNGRVAVGWRYSGTQYNTLDNRDPNGFTFTGDSAFTVFDLRARYETQRWTASLGVDNLGNEEYWAFHPYTRRMLFAELGVRF